MEEELAQNFSEALIASYRISRRDDVASEQADPELTRRFSNIVISYLDARAAHIFAASREQLAQVHNEQGNGEVPAESDQMPEQESDELPEEPDQASDEQMPEQASVGAYMDFLNSIVAYYMEGGSTTASYQWNEEAVERGLRASQE
jgi:hypothetical protein